MHAIHDYAIREVLGMPVWAWALVLSVLAVNDAIKAAKWTRAESFIEAIALSILNVPFLGPALIAKLPVIGWVLHKLAGLDKPATLADTVAK